MSREQVDIDVETTGTDPRTERIVEAGSGKYKVQPLEAFALTKPDCLAWMPREDWTMSRVRPAQAASFAECPGYSLPPSPPKK